MEINKKNAGCLDYILKGYVDENRIDYTGDEYKEYFNYAKYLKENGYMKVIFTTDKTFSVISISPKGDQLIKDGGFTAIYTKNEIKRIKEEDLLSKTVEKMGLEIANLKSKAWMNPTSLVISLLAVIVSIISLLMRL